MIEEGAAWVWNVAEDVCPDGRQVDDWIHVVQHLAQAAEVLYPCPTDTPKRLRWLNAYTDPCSIVWVAGKVVVTGPEKQKPASRLALVRLNSR